MLRKNESHVDALKTIFDEAAEAVCQCVSSAEVLLRGASPNVREAIERHFPKDAAENAYYTAT